MWFEHMGWPTALKGLWRGALGVLGASLVVLCLAGLMSASAWPRMHGGPGVMDGGRRMASPVLPLDGSGAFATPAAAYSFRKLKSTYTGPGIRLRRASDNAEADIPFLGFTGFTGAPIDTAAAASHCSATTCTVVTWYDQSGNGKNIGPAGEQPALTFNCQGGLPCVASTGTGQVLYVLAGAQTPVLPTTFSTVAQRTTGSGACAWNDQQGAGNYWGSWITADTWHLGGAILAAATSGVFHAATGIVGAGATLRIDATETAGTFAGSTTAGLSLVNRGTTPGVCQMVESIRWDGYALTASERAALTANQKSFWGTP